VQVALIFLNHRKLIECGIPIKQTSNRRKYCSSCWKKRHQELKNKWKREKWNKGRSLENTANLHK
jgi:protein-arginine kinase activator protein McsA